jgi:hypothetical protein
MIFRSLTLLAATLAIGASSPALALQNCSYQGIVLYGEVAVVTNDADLRVEVVTSGADLRVQWVDRHPNACGEWRRVGLGADFTVQIVPSGGDIRIQEVTGTPGAQ